MEVTRSIQIPDEELHWSFARAGGPGGQNVNKVSSKAVLRWNVSTSVGLPEPVRDRLRSLYGARLTADGDLIVTSQRWREQGRNRDDCLEKLREMVRHAAETPRTRKPTKSTRGGKERRLAAKRRQSSRKQARRSSFDD